MMAGSLMAFWFASLTDRSGSTPRSTWDKGEDGVQRLLERRAVPLPPHGKPRDQRLGGGPRPAATELHGVLFGDYNIIGAGRAPHEPGQVVIGIAVMVPVRQELYLGSGRPQLRRHAFRVGNPRRGEDAPPGKPVEPAPRSRLHPLQAVQGEARHAHRSPRPGLREPEI